MALDFGRVNHTQYHSDVSLFTETAKRNLEFSMTISLYKIIQTVRALWLAIKPFYMSVCKHGFRSSFISYASRRGFLRLSRVLPTSRVFTSGYVNTETILHFFNEKLTDSNWTRHFKRCMVQFPCGLKAPMTWVRFSSATKWYNWATIKYDKNDNNEETSKNNSSGLKKGILREI